MMKNKVSSSLATSVLLPVVLLLFLFANVEASSSALDKFIQCFSCHSKASQPISDIIYTRTNPSFLTILQSYIRDSKFNTSSTPKPMAIITALDVFHVQETVRCAKATGLHVRIRSGGHDFEGLSYIAHVPFIILDMFNIRSIDVDIPSETAWVQAGASLGELYYEIANKSRIHAFPAGVCHTVGVGGHITGGGYGNMLRKYGLSIDNVIDALVVDANGRVLTRKTMGEDLFWAIRGGGAASFCVIIAWKIKLVRVPEIVTVFTVSKTLQQNATDAVLQWQEVAHNIDHNLFIRLEIKAKSQEGSQRTVVVSFIGQYLGRASSLLSLTKHSFPLLGLQKQDCIEMPWVETTLYWYGFPIGTPTEQLLERIPTPPNNYREWISDYVKHPVPREGLETMWKKMIDLDVDTVWMQWNPYGGRMSEIPANATAFPHRAGNIIKILYLSTWEDDSVEALRLNIEGNRELRKTFTPYVSSNPREGFLNYRNLDMGTNENGNLEFAYDFFKDNVKRLLEVKAKVDPTDFFHYEQSIPVVIAK